MTEPTYATRTLGRRRLCAAAAGLALPTAAWLAPAKAAAQSAPRADASSGAWPQKPVRIVVNAPPGGTADVAARIVGEGLSASLGHPFIVDAKGGGSGTIGVMDVLRSPADGYTLLVSVDGAFTEVPHSVKVAFDPLKDMRPVADIYLGSLVLIGNDAVPANTLPELLEWVRRQPGGVNYASYSAGTMSHILGAQLAKAAGVSLHHIPYRGSPSAMQDLLGGQVPLMFNGIGNVLPQLKGGRVRVYAIAAEQRSEFLPEVPTFKELGYPELMSLVWMGLWTQPQVPAQIVERLHAEVARILAQPATRQRFKEIGFTPAAPRRPDELARAVQADYQRTGAILRTLGVTPT